MDRRLSAIFRDGEIENLNSVVEAEGSTAQRLRIIENAMLSKPT